MMSTYPVDDLLHRWAWGELSLEQALGYLLQKVVTLSEQLAEAERAIRKLEQELTARK